MGESDKKKAGGKIKHRGEERRAKVRNKEETNNENKRVSDGER